MIIKLNSNQYAMRVETDFRTHTHIFKASSDNEALIYAEKHAIEILQGDNVESGESAGIEVDHAEPMDDSDDMFPGNPKSIKYTKSRT